MQHALAQGIGPLFAPHVSTHRSGFRPGRRARMARAARAEAPREGLRYAVDGDLQRCCDTVHQRWLMTRRARRSTARRVLRRLRRSWRAGGIRPDGSRAHTLCGGPPGGPLSPRLAKGRRADLDAERERRGRRVARSADDCRLVVRSQAAAPRGWRRRRRFLEGRWRRRSTWTTRKAARLRAGAVLGFEVKRGQWRWTEAAGPRCNERTRELTARSHGRRMASRIEALQRYGPGGRNDCGHRHSSAELVEVDHGRRRVRRCSWNQWTRPRPRRRHLLARGLARDDVQLAPRSRQGDWRMAGNRIVPRALTNQWWWAQGVPNLRPQGVGLHDGASAP